MHNFYIKTNDGSPGMAKYGYVKGNETSLSNRIHDSCEEHPELSTFIYIFKFEKNEKYIYYKEIDKIVSLIGSDIKKIEIVEDNNSDDENESDISDEFNVDLPDDLR